MQIPVDLCMILHTKKTQTVYHTHYVHKNPKNTPYTRATARSQNWSELAEVTAYLVRPGPNFAQVLQHYSPRT